ncbi:MAG: hypothetical protein QGG71_26505 [Pirellulaceae bacterium]|jgi:DNA-binding transcriptional ArsR family regulator|nr:hypothetical protein [Pirellulaceae bacterium]
MKEFSALRTKARERRDKAIKRARDEYAETLVRIANLEQDLVGRDSSTHLKISEAIERVIPDDRTFTTVDVIAGLEALDPGRVWRKRSIDNHISRLRDKGLVRRIKKSKNTEPAVYARMGVEVEAVPFEDMTLPEVIAATLAEPMTQTELVVAIMEAGYDTTMSRRALRDAVGMELRKARKRFSADHGKWSLL